MADLPFRLPGEPGASISGTLERPGDANLSDQHTEHIHQPHHARLRPADQYAGPGGAKGAVLDPTRHIPIAIAAQAHAPEEPGAHAPDVVVMDGHRVNHELGHVYGKDHHFGTDVYFYLLSALLLRIAVFFMLALAGAPQYAGIYATTFFLEFLLLFFHAMRSRAGGHKLLKLSLVIMWTFIAVSLAFAISSCITNWVHFEKQGLRWTAVGLSFTHALLYFGSIIATANILQAKLVLSLRTIMLDASNKLRSGPSESEDAKRMKST